MFKKAIAFLLAAMLIFTLSISAHADLPVMTQEEKDFYVIDDGAVLTDVAKDVVLSANTTLRTSTGGEVVVVLTRSEEGRDNQAFAKKFGAENGVGSAYYQNGMVMVIETDTGVIGYAIGKGYEPIAEKLEQIFTAEGLTESIKQNPSTGITLCFSAVIKTINESGIGGEEYVKDNNDYTFSGFRQNAAGGMTEVTVARVSAATLITLIILLVSVIALFVLAALKRVERDGSMPLWPLFFKSGRDMLQDGWQTIKKVRFGIKK
jgi:uncharacterized membrane protein YgcG